MKTKKQKAAEYARKWRKKHPKSDKRKYSDRLEYAREYREKNRDRINKWKRDHYKDYADVTRNCNLKNNYGITLEDYDRMFAEQGGVCKVCGRSNGSMRLCVDHDHETGKVRSLLCSQCNIALGMVKDDTERLMKLVKYLESFEQD